MAGEKVPAAWSPTLLRIALGLVYVHFGLLKFYPDLSPAELLGSQTVMRLSLQWLDARAAMTFLASLECLIGVALLFNVFPRTTLVLFLIHMAGTFLPLFVLPELMFKIAPFAPTLEGEFILKNIVLVVAGLTILVPALRRRTPSDVGTQEDSPPDQSDRHRSGASRTSRTARVPLTSRASI